MHYSLKQQPSTFVLSRGYITILSLGLVLTPSIDIGTNDFRLSLESKAFAESSLPASKNTLIRRPTVSHDDKTTDRDSTGSIPLSKDHSADAQTNLTTNIKDNEQPFTQSARASSTAELSIAHPNEQSPETEADDSRVPTPEEQNNTASRSNASEAHGGLSAGTTIPIFSTPLASPSTNSSSSRNLSKATSSASAFSRQASQSAAPPSRKLTQRPGIAEIISRRPVPRPPQVSSPPPSVPPTPKPKPAPTPAPAPPPAPPTLSSVTLTWSPNNTDPDFAGYKVYRKTSPGAPYTTPIATLKGNITTFQSTGLKTGTTYYFVLTAYDIIGNESGYSNEVSQSIF